MVFESIVADLLNRVLGDYVENLDGQQLSIGIWGGDVVLQDLVLKRNALDDLNLPVQTVYGCLGKLVLKIPWKNLYGAPVEAAIERLYLLVVPNQEVKYDPVKEEKMKQDSKQSDLRRIEAAKKKEAEQGKRKADDTFVEKLATQIVKNVQIKIKEIHVRYEDSVTNPGKPFAFGITLNNLSIETTNSEWKPAIITEAVSQIFKILNLDALAVYWNCNCPLYSEMKVNDILKYFSEGIAKKDNKAVDYNYVLGPINSSARLRLNPKPEQDVDRFSIPKISLNLEMEKLSIGITKRQYRDVMLLADSMTYMAVAVPYRKYRPFVKTYKGHYREWWRFAYTCILEENVRRRHKNWDWGHISEHRKLCKEYAQVYQTKLQSKKVPSEITEKIKKIEEKLDVFNLVLIRQRIELELERLERKTEEMKNKRKQGTWFSGWWGGAASQEDKDLTENVDFLKKFEDAMTPEEKSKLYRAIDYQENSAPAEYPEMYIATNCGFVLRLLEVEIRDETLTVPRVLNIELKGVNVRLQQRPATSALKVAVKIEQFTVFGLHQSNYLPQLISSEDFSEGGVLLDVMFETHPLDKKCDSRLRITALPVKVIYDAETILKLADIFKTKESTALDQLQAVANTKLAEIKELSATGLQHTIEKHETIDVDINFSAPYIIVPYKGLYSDPRSLLIINLGCVKIKSVTRESSLVNIKKLYKMGTTEDEILKEVFLQSYDKFLLELTDMQVLLAYKDENWRACISDETICSMHILQPMNLIFNLNKCLVADDPRLPKIKLTGQLPSLVLNITEDRILALVALIASIPLPKEQEIKPAPLQNVVAKSSVISLLMGDTQQKKTLQKKQHEPVEDLNNFVQLTDLDMKFEMKALTIIISQTKSKPNKLEEPHKVLEFKCISLECEVILQKYNMDVIARLGGIGLTHFRNTDLCLISTPMTSGENEYLFIVEYLNVNKKSPEFHSKHGSCEQLLQFTFSKLKLLLHQESLLELMSWAKAFQVKIEKFTKPPEADRIVSARRSSKRLFSIDELSTKTTKSGATVSHTTSKKVIVVDTINIKLVANLNEFDVILANEKCQLAIFAINGVSSDIIVKNSYTQIKAILKDISVFDCNSKSIHQKVLCKTGEEDAIYSQVVLYNNKTEARVNKNDMSVTVSMSCLKITFLNLFISSILNFLNKFQAGEAIAEASAAAAETAKLNMQNIAENASRIELNIKLKAPVIIIPTNSKSYDAIMIDLGKIELTNKFSIFEVQLMSAKSAVVDELRLNLFDVKLSRILLNEFLENKNECTLLKPLSFSLKIKRNLSASWYNCIPDVDIAGEMKTIELNVSEADYSRIMSVLEENLAEGNRATEKQSNLNIKADQSSVNFARSTSKEPKTRVKTILEVEPAKSHTALRFTFTMESLIINLFRGGATTIEDVDSLEHKAEDGLARFTLLVLSLKGSILSDSSISTSLLLIDCLLDDTRVSQKGQITRLMSRKQDIRTAASASDHIQRSMIDVTFQQKDNNTFADVRVYSFDLILSIDYLMKIGEFFTPPKKTIARIQEDAVALSIQQHSTKSKTSIASKKQAAPEGKESSFALNLKVERPDIILVERMDDSDARALVFNSEILMNIRLAGDKQNIRGSISNLQLYTCCYNPKKRNETKFLVLRPCDINIVGATPPGEGLHLDVIVTEVRLSVSPAFIELLSRCQSTMTGTKSADDNNESEIKYYEDIWDSEPFNETDYWYLKTEEGIDASINPESFSIEPAKKVLNEFCHVSFSSIICTVEAGVGTKTIPMLMLNATFEAKVNNWTSKLYIESLLSIKMAYYNNRLAVWEPLIEPVEVMKDNSLVHQPWSLKLEVKKNDEDPSVSSPQSETEYEELIFTPPAMSINFSSAVNLEIVVTKTLLEVITNLSKAFTNAVQSTELSKEVDTAPFKVINDSGLKVTLMLENCPFRVYSPGLEVRSYNEILLECGAEVQLDWKLENISSSSLHLERNLSSFLTQKAKDDFITVLVNDMNCILNLPVNRADKRYFSLNYRGENKDNWGIISDVNVDGATSFVTLRSMLQVHNHFNQSVNVYYMTNRGNELESIKQVPPGGLINVPLHAVYTLTNELFFSVEGHSVTAVPYIWKDLQHNLTMVKTLHCPAGSGKLQEPQFIMKVCGDIEQIFYENTSIHTMASNCYNIHLRPATSFQNYLPIPVVCVIQNSNEELTVKPGEQLLMPTVNPGNSYLILKLQNYLEKEWCCKFEVPLNSLEFSVWQFDSYDSSVKMTLDLGMHCTNKNGSLIMTLYCPFWMLNKTGFMLSYRKSSKVDKSSGSPAKNSEDTVNVLHHPKDFKGPILFSFPAKKFFGKKKAALRIQNGEWSDKFPMDVAGSSGMVVCRANNFYHQIGVNNQLTYNGLTKQVTFTPYFVILNNTPFIIECQELERPADPWIVVHANSCETLWPQTELDDKLLKIKIQGTKEISAPFLYSEVNNTLLKLPNKYGGINVDVQVTEGGIFITFTPYGPGSAPALILNHTNYEMRLWEKESVNVKQLRSKQRLLYTWDNPTGPRLLVWETGKKKEIEDDLRKDGLGEFSIEENKTIYWVSFLDGMQRILLFTEDINIARDAQSAGYLEKFDREINASIHGVGVSFVNNFIRQEIMYIGIASSGIIWEVCKMSSKRYKQLSVKECTLIEAAYQQYLAGDLGSTNSIVIDPKTEVDFTNELMLRPHKRKLRRAFQTGLWLQIISSPNQMQIHAKINRVQIDNQMYDCIFPVILAPVPPPKSVAADTALKPFAELSIVQRIMKYSNVQQYKYFKVLIQEFHIKVDLGFVNALMAMLQSTNASEYEEAELFEKEMALVNEPLMSHISAHSLQEQKNFYDLLHFSPLKIHISFSLAAPGSSAGADASSYTPAFINVLLQGLGVTLTDMNDVVFRLAYFEREYSFLTQKQLIRETSHHYVGQFVKQLYVLVLGLDVIGNPYGLVLGISKGVEDLFYEPFQGAIQGPGEFAEGVVLGVRSLFGHTVGGAAGAVSRITGAMGKGIAVLTFDKDYQRKRRDQINKKPANIQEGIARGGKGLVMGVVDGVTGVFTKPVQGAKEQGVGGFFKGLGKGAVGLVTRPTAGVIDFASGSLDAVKRAAELGDDVLRLRAPRFMRMDGVVRPYIKSEAEGNKLLIELEKGKYASTDIYDYHLWIIEKKDVLLLTDKRIAYVVHNDIFGGWQIDWAYTWQEINQAKVVDKGIQITTLEPKKKVLGVFGSGETGKAIIIGDVSQREIIINKIVLLRKNALAK